jgi:hypothetical protein
MSDSTVDDAVALLWGATDIINIDGNDTPTGGNNMKPPGRPKAPSLPEELIARENAARGLDYARG